MRRHSSQSTAYITHRCRLDSRHALVRVPTYTLYLITFYLILSTASYRDSNFTNFLVALSFVTLHQGKELTHTIWGIQHTVNTRYNSMIIRTST